MSARVLFKAGELRRVSGPAQSARAEGFEPVESVGASPFWRAIKQRQEDEALRLLEVDPTLALSALGVAPGEAGGWDEDQERPDWLGALNAAVQQEMFGLSGALVERGAPLDTTEVNWEGVKRDAAQYAPIDLGMGVDQMSVKMFARLPLSYALRASSLKGEHRALGSLPAELQGRLTGPVASLETIAAAALGFRDALARSRRSLIVPPWAGGAAGQLAFCATSPLYSKDPLSAELNAARAEALEGIWSALIEGGSNPFKDPEKGEFAGRCALRSAAQSAKAEDLRFAMSCVPLLERCGGFEAIGRWGAQYQAKVLDRLRNRGLGEWAEAMEAWRTRSALSEALASPGSTAPLAKGPRL